MFSIVKLLILIDIEKVYPPLLTNHRLRMWLYLLDIILSILTYFDSPSSDDKVCVDG